MSYFADLIVGRQIDCALVDSKVTYIMLDNGTQITIRGWGHLFSQPLRIESKPSLASLAKNTRPIGQLAANCDL